MPPNEPRIQPPPQPAPPVGDGTGASPEDCYRNPCADCGARIPLWARFGTLSSGGVICPECLASGQYICCRHCGDYGHADDMSTYRGRAICHDCADQYVRECYECAEPILGDDIWTSPDGEALCRDCFRDTYFDCAICGRACSRDDRMEGRDGESLCPDCHDRHCGPIRGHSYTPDPLVFHHLPRDPDRRGLHFGVELEVESPDIDDARDVARSLPDYFYCKTDGSLSHNGIEIVSHPATWGWLRANQDVWGQVLGLRRHRWRSYQTSTCGMHIHLTKRAFGRLHLYRFMSLFYGAPGWTRRIAGRRACEIRDWASTELHRDAPLVRKARDMRGENRYTAVNLCPSRTVELRIFKGTLSATGFWRNLEVCRAAYLYTQSAGLRDVSVPGLARWTMDNRKSFPNLSAWFARRGQRGQI